MLGVLLSYVNAYCSQLAGMVCVNWSVTCVEKLFYDWEIASNKLVYIFSIYLRKYFYSLYNLHIPFYSDIKIGSKNVSFTCRYVILFSINVMCFYFVEVHEYACMTFGYHAEMTTLSQFEGMICVNNIEN